MRLKALALVAGLVIGIVVAPALAEPQQSSKVARIGWFGATTRSGNEDLIAGFREGLKQLGYEEGRNVVIEYRFADGSFDRLPGLAAELVALGLDVIAVSSTPAALALKGATKTVPIVIVGVGNPEKSGIVASLVRPGANITGVAGAFGDFAAKWVELLRQAAPKAGRVGYLYSSSNADNRLRANDVIAAGKTLGAVVQGFPVASLVEVETQLAAIARTRMQAVVVDSDATLRARRSETIEFLARARLPAIYGGRDYVDAGGLMSYAPSRPEMARRAATYVDKILKGAKPADLPVERPTRFELVLNLKTAKSIGVTFPPGLLRRADEILQ